MPTVMEAPVFSEPLELAEVELSVLGSLMLSPSIIDQVNLILSPDDFFHVAYGNLHACLTDMHSAGVPIEPRSGAIQCKNLIYNNKSLLDSLGGFSGLAKIVQGTAHPGHALYYAHYLRRASNKRRTKKLGQMLIDDADDITIDPEHSIARIEHLASMLAADGDQVVTMAEAMNLAKHAMIERRTDRRRAIVPYGWYSLDSTCGGMYSGDLIVIGARPSIGKTAFGAQILAYNAARDRCVLMVSIEMTATDLAIRQLASELQLPVKLLRSGAVGDQVIANVQAAMAEQSHVKYLIWDARTASVNKICAMVRMLRKTKNVECVVVDYLQRISPSHPSQKAYERVTDACEKLKSLALELEIPVIALSQLTRSAEGSRPTLNELRDSGSIEAEADVILLMHRKDRSSPETTIDIAKVRNGETGVVSMEFDGPSTTFVDKASF
jgi:replicative DNA helicase